MSENMQPSIGTSVDDDDLDIDAIFGGKPTKSVETPFPLPTEQASTEAPANIAPQLSRLLFRKYWEQMCYCLA